MKIFDGHMDIWCDVSKKRKEGCENIVKNFHLERLKKGEVFGGVFAAWLDNKYSDEDSEKEFIYMLNSVSHEINSNPEIFNIIKSRKDLEKEFSKEKLTILMGVEGLRAVGNNLDWLDTLYNLGYRLAALTWNEKNILGTGAGENSCEGLTEIGKKAVRKMNELGMIVDVSHANEKTFWDIAEISTKPFIASHSNARALCDVPRNLTDEQIKAVAQSGGVIGVNGYIGFIKKCDFSSTVPIENPDLSSKPDLKDLADNIDYIVGLVGVDYVGLGFDFCEYLSEELKDTNPKNLEDASKCQNMIEELRKRGYSENDIEKIAYKNFLRVIKEILH